MPTILFIMQSIESLNCYGKHIFGARIGLPIHDRAPALRSTALGLELVAAYARRLGPSPD